jgi:intracellular multiplication protein IcmV
MKKFLGKVFKVREWSDWDRNMSGLEYIKIFINNFLNSGQVQPVKAKDFEKVTKKYNLDEKKLSQQSNGLLGWCVFFILFYLICLGFVIFNFVNGNLKTVGIGFCISLIPLSLAFRYHFYYTAIKFKRLDCTIKDWIKLTFGGSLVP